MDERSWWEVAPESPEHRLPDDLRARDPGGGRDCGWTTQMRPFVRRYSQPGATVFDPFCGFGTTLLAAALEGRRGLGMEIDPDRAALARERLRRHGVAASVIVADVTAAAIASPIDLCLTNVPYFGGCRRARTVASTHAEMSGQLYDAPDFEAYLAGLRAVFHVVREALPEDAFCIAMVENIHLGSRHFDRRRLPIAFELARILDSLFLPCDERILCYPPRMPGVDSTGDVDGMTSDRTHEYALVYRKRPIPIDPAATRAELAALREAGFVATVHGSFAAWVDGDPADASHRPGDLDLRVPPDAANWSALTAWLRDRGYRLSLWGEATTADVSLERVRAHHYLRAERIGADGATVWIDIGIET